MFCGIELSNEFSQEIGTLNLDVFHMRNFRYYISLAKHDFFRYWNSLKTLYVVHPDEVWVRLSTQEIEEACHILS